MADRTLSFSIFRYNPNIAGDKPKMQDYELQEMPHMTLYMALNKIREEQDSTLHFDFVCRAGICGSCGMMVNGKIKLGCKTMIKDLKKKIILMPLPTFKLIGDLSVDTGTFFMEMNKKTESWVHASKKFDPKGTEERMENDVALKIYEADRCIECGCCIAVCETVNIHPEFQGAATINRVARFILDPRDERTSQQYFEVIGNEEGTFGCVGLMACDDFCPQEIPLQLQLSFVRRNMLKAGLGIGK